jgi:Sulfotransferase family
VSTAPQTQFGSSRGSPRLAHLKASQYVACGYVTPEQFRGYFKFSFVRNPWDRVVSFYKDSKRGRGLSFNTFLSRELVGREWHKRYWFVGPQHEFLFDAQRTPLVDFIGRFETLQADFDHVCRRFGIPPTALPHVNRSRGLSPLYPLIALRSLLSTRRARPVSRYAAYMTKDSAGSLNGFMKRTSRSSNTALAHSEAVHEHEVTRENGVTRP